MKSIRKYLLAALLAAALLGIAFLVKAAYDAAIWRELEDNFRPMSEIVINLNEC